VHPTPNYIATSALKLTLFVDGNSNAQGSEADVALFSSDGEVLEYSMSFTFPSSN